ncbi:NADH-quinone oxidoreductase subunit A [bacterium]|nr:NADH-quinone oxidoreductase subunit A [bacterium]
MPYQDYNWVALFILAGIAFTGVALLVAWLIRPSRIAFSKLTTYECGEEPQYTAWIRYNPRFYVIAIIFLVFDVDVVFMFPWASAYKILLFGIPYHFEAIGLPAFGEMFIFLVILLLGWLFAWKKGAFEWV